MGKIVGYARVSRKDQDLSLQMDALLKYGIPKSLIFTDKISGAKAERPGLDSCLKALESGDVLVVWKLDRLGRSLINLLTLIEKLQSKGVHFKSLMDGAIDTTNAGGRLIFHVFSALAEFERELISERTKAGTEAARARGRFGGRPKSELSQKAVMAYRLYKQTESPVMDICKTLSISKTTFYRYVDRVEEGLKEKESSAKSTNLKLLSDLENDAKI